MIAIIAGILGTIAGAIAGAAATAWFGYAKEKRKARARATEAHLNALRAELLGFWEPLAGYLGASKDAFQQQCGLRNRLWGLLEAKGDVTPEICTLEWPERLESLYPKMDTSEERSLHEFIREVTYSSLFNDNDRMLQLLFANSPYMSRLARLAQLRDHLQFWIAKANSAKGRNEVALVYVGTRDNKPFPSGIEQEVKGVTSQLQAEIVSVRSSAI